MHHNLGIITILTFGFALASSLGYLTQRLRLPSILGYLLAGFIIGPYSPGFVADLSLSEQLAEIGVILMLFGVGLHFKLEDLILVKKIAVPGAVGQTLVTTIIATCITYMFGWTLEAGLIIGLSTGVASTVVLVRVLNDNHLLHTEQGHIAVGWLVVEDIFTVIILILLPTFAAFSAGHHLSFASAILPVALVLSKFFVLALFMFTWGHQIVGFLLNKVARLRSQELFTITVLALVFLIATGSSIIFGTSMALGAFIAGMVVGKTNVRYQVAANALPLKDIFAIIFFLSVGMLFNPAAIFDNLPLFLGILFVILIIKPISAYFLTIYLGCTLKVALTVAIALSQVGEFSFILAEEAMRLDLLPDEGFDVLVACALISISLNPLLFELLEWFEKKIQKLKKHPNEASLLEIKKNEELDRLPKAIVIGHGPVGREVTALLKELGFYSIIIEQNIDTVSKLEQQKWILFGDASDSNILKEAHIETSQYLFITIPNTEKALEIIHTARRANPGIQILARAQFLEEKILLEKAKVLYVCAETETIKAFNHQVRHLLMAKS